jgi:quinol monooxygenase YgiN
MDTGSDKSEEIHLLVEATLRQSEQEFTDFATQLCEIVRSDEPDVLTYEWWVSPLGSEEGLCWVEERYANRQTFIGHMNLLRESGQIRQLVKILRVKQILVLEGDSELVNKELAPLVPVALKSVATI